MSKTVVHTDSAPKAIGPYSQAVVTAAQRLVFCSGQVGLDPKTGELVNSSFAAEAAQVMENLRAVLAAAGLTFDDVIRCGVFLTNFADFSALNEVYGKYFPSSPPARTTVQVSALPRGARVEIDAIAAARGG